MRDDTQKIIDLEMKLAFLERTLEELSGVVLDQGREVERVNRRLEELDGRLTAKQDGAGAEQSDPLEERPPHY